MAYYWDDYLGNFVYSEDGSSSGDTGWDDYTGSFTGSGDTGWDDYLGNFVDYGAEYNVTEITNPAQPGQEGYGWRYFSDGTVISPQGAYYTQGSDKPIWTPEGTGFLGGIGKSAVNALMSAFKKPDGGVDWEKLATVGGGLAGLLGVGQNKQQPTGYQGSIPQYTAVRERVPGVDPEGRRPGSGGQRYFSDVQYAKPGEEAAAQATAAEQATGLAALQAPPVQTQAAETAPETEEMAAGGLAGLKQGKYLRGPTDGMEDKLRTTIENKQPAALSHGEFVVPADVVSHLGNGNSEAGAKKLYEMMDRIRQARTGTKKQGKQVNPNKYMPA
jgi:hypothetical protein